MKTCLRNQRIVQRVVYTTARGTSDTVHAGSCLCVVQFEVPTQSASILFQNGLGQQETSGTTLLCHKLLLPICKG